MPARGPAILGEGGQGTDDKKMQVGTVRATSTGSVNRTRKQMRCGVGGTEAAELVGWLKMGQYLHSDPRNHGQSSLKRRLVSYGTEHCASQTLEACLGWERADSPPAGKCTPCSVPPAAKDQVRNSLAGQTKGRGRRDLLTHCLRSDAQRACTSSHKEGWVARPAKESLVVMLILTSGLTVCKTRTEFPFVKSCLPRASKRQDAAPLISTTSCREGRRQVLHSHSGRPVLGRAALCF